MTRDGNDNWAVMWGFLPMLQMELDPQQLGGPITLPLCHPLCVCVCV